MDLSDKIDDSESCYVSARAIAPETHVASDYGCVLFSLVHSEIGLYDADNNLLASWDELVNNYGVNVTMNYGNASSSTNPYNTTTSSLYYALSNHDELKTGTKLIVGKVESIGKYAFYGCTGLTNIVLPEGIEYIENYAFEGCTSLMSIDIPHSVIALNAAAFRGCTSLTNVTIVNGLREIGHSAFYGCKNLVSIEIPNSVMTLSNSAFQGCASLVDVTIGNSITRIGNYAFNGCNNLTSITIPGSVESIGPGAFESCNLTSVTIEDGVSDIGDFAFRFCKSLTSITIPNSVTSIGANTFLQCASLENFMFDGTIEEWKSIRFDAGWIGQTPATGVVCDDGTLCFKCSVGAATCQSNATCPVCGNEYGERGHCTPIDGVCSLCGKNCTVIESAHSPYANSNYVVLGTWDYSNATSVNITITYQTEAQIQDWCSITAGTDYVAGKSYGDTRSYLATDGSIISGTGYNSSVKFSGQFLKSITFENVDMLTGSVIFKTNNYNQHYYGIMVTITPNGGPYEALNTPEITLNSKTLNITPVEGAMEYEIYVDDELICTTAETVVDLSNELRDDDSCYVRVRAIAPGSYFPSDYGCVWFSLTRMQAGLYDINNNLLVSWNSLINDYVMDIAQDYTSESYKTSINSPYYVLTSNSDWSTGVKLIIGEDVIKIGNCAFYGCTNLVSVDTGDGAMSIGNSSFNGCTNLANIYIGDNITSIGDVAFERCTSLKNIVIADKVTTIGDGAFYRCTGLVSVDIGDGVTDIKSLAFYSCTSLTSLSIGCDVTNIDNDSFRNCTQLTNITFKGTIERWDAIAFGSDWNCLAPATEVVCSNGVVSLVD